MTSSTRSVLTIGAAGAAVAAIVNLVVFAIADAAGASFEFVQNGRATEVNYGLVALVSVASILLGAVLAALLGPRRLRLVQIIGVVVAVLSAGGPLSLTGASSAKAVLVLLHLITGAVFVIALELVRRRTAADEPAASAEAQP